MSLRELPELNAFWSVEKGCIQPSSTVDITVNVPLEDRVIGLLLRKADSLSLEEISFTLKDLTEKTRDGQLSPDAYRGSLFG
jgi:pyruvate/2-oxoglutarate dehydrogenase complex dihydrolipoamide acyltransferase (E2) component